VKAPERALDPAVGLCSGCRHAARQESERGSVFWRCLRAEGNADFQRYPPLPVARCPGYEEGVPRTRGDAKERR
jgi:hypothetical protein